VELGSLKNENPWVNHFLSLDGIQSGRTARDGWSFKPKRGRQD
jgi:hypothetical protein